MNYLPENGWLIESTTMSFPRWWTGSSWTNDSVNAIRFARKTDAARAAGAWLLKGVIFTEHMWCNNE